MEVKQYTPKQPMDKKEIAREIKRYIEMNENENITLNELKAVLKGKIIAITAYCEKKVGSPINKLTSQLKKLDKNKQTKLETINKK